MDIIRHNERRMRVPFDKITLFSFIRDHGAYYVSISWDHDDYYNDFYDFDELKQLLRAWIRYDGKIMPALDALNNCQPEFTIYL